ncbi:MAG: hypothetical protein DYG89_31320 [Caldilinea sp. CFX5]|nr:hypothetical protein [Caldilinea sp. CFX5]
MYIDQIRLQNVKCFEDVMLYFQTAHGDNPDRQQNWNVIIGNNGDGKSTLLQAIAACLVDVTTAEKLLNLETWVRQGQAKAQMNAQLQVDFRDLPGTPVAKELYLQQATRSLSVQHIVVGADQTVPLSSTGERKRFPTATMLEPIPDYQNEFENYAQIAKDLPLFTGGYRTWLMCGYGPYRRIAGGRQEQADRLDLKQQFRSLFDEGVALTNCESWLKELQRKALLAQAANSKEISPEVFQKVVNFLTDLLPGIDEISVKQEIQFRWRGQEVHLRQLSDGYRSMFALVVDLLQWVVHSDPDYKWLDNPYCTAKGVVLIDEIDAHLHPKWQREIGFVLTRIFPNLQFIVTSHSPFVAMAAGKGALTVLENVDGVVVADQQMPYAQDWAVDRVLTDLFDVSDRSLKTEQDLVAYEQLHSQRRKGQLTTEDQQRLTALEIDLNRRLVGDRVAPAQQSLDADLAYLKSLLHQN